MRSHKTIGLAALALISALGMQRAMAGPVFVNFEGQLIDVREDLEQFGLDPLDTSIVVGASFSGSFSYDPGVATDMDARQDHGWYSIGVTLTGRVGSIGFETFDPFVLVVDDINGDALTVVGEGDGETVGLPFDHVEIHFFGSPTAFDSDALPTVIDLEDFVLDSSFWISRTFLPPDDDTPFFFVEGTITSLSVIPEPGTLSLLALGSLLVIWRRSLFQTRHMRKPCSTTPACLFVLTVVPFVGVNLAAADSTEGPFVSIQVNVDTNGSNTVGDAGNEPSIAIDPTDPNKMVIAFRHFFTIVGNNSRSDAGVAYSTDSGISWTMDVLDPQPLNRNGDRDCLRVACCHAASRPAPALDRTRADGRIGDRNKSWGGQVA